MRARIGALALKPCETGTDIREDLTVPVLNPWTARRRKRAGGKSMGTIATTPKTTHALRGISADLSACSFVAAADASGSRLASRAVLCSSGSLDRSNRVKRSALMDSDPVVMPFYGLPHVKTFQLHKRPSPVRGAAEQCVND